MITRRASLVFVGLILAAGGLRFLLTINGVPNAVARYSSMSVIMLIGTVYFGLLLPQWKDRMKASYILLLPYMVVEVAALGYTWASGTPTIFHIAEYSFDTPIALHFWGHVIGGLTWEPWITFLIMSVIAWVAARSRVRTAWK